MPPRHQADQSLYLLQPLKQPPRLRQPLQSSRKALRMTPTWRPQSRPRKASRPQSLSLPLAAPYKRASALLRRQPLLLSAPSQKVMQHPVASLGVNGYLIHL